MANQYGEVSWNDASGSDNSVNNKDLWLRLEQGKNIVRLVTKPQKYAVHRVKKDADNPKDFGQKVNCSKVHGSCPACDLTGEEPKNRYLLGVIDRKTGSYKILDISPLVFNGIKNLANDTEFWGDPMTYDINIIVNKNAGPTGYYSVQPAAKIPLSAAEQVMKDEIDMADLQRRVNPPNVEQVQKRLDKIFGDGERPQPKSVAQAVKAMPAKKNLTTVAQEEVDEDFPNYEEKTA